MEPTPICDDWEFFEADELIVCVPPAQARCERARLLEIDPSYQSWQLEAFSNHVHFDGQEATREELRHSVREAEVLAAALRRAYPQQRFVILHRLGSTLSFYQALPGAPTVDQEPPEPHPELRYCRLCKGHHPFHLQPQPDPEFPELEWLTCAACGQEGWLCSRNRLTLVEPDAP